MPDTASNQPYVFISYASADRERVLPLVDRLEAAGVRTWIDRDGIHGGANYAQVITEAVKGSAVLLVMCSQASLSSRNVRQELALGWRFEKPYLPLLLEPVTLPDEVSYWLEAAQWIEVLDHAEAIWLPTVMKALDKFGAAPRISQPKLTKPRPLLVGREREQGVLREHLELMLQGQGGSLLVGGEAGIGKTTLVEDQSIEAEERGCLVLLGHAYDLSVTPPYGPWLEIFRQYRALADLSLPSLPAFIGNAEELAKVGSQDALFVAVAEFVEAVAAQRSVMLIVDDLHWVDQASLDFFRFLARRVASCGILLVATYRSDELHRRHPLYTLLPVLVREAGAQRLDVKPLDAGGHEALIQSRYRLSEVDQARLETYLEERAEGNPLYARELLRTLEDEGALREQNQVWVVGDLVQARVPLLLRQILERRIGRFDDESQRLFEVAAVIGQTVQIAVWRQVGEVAEDALLTLSERAEEVEILEGMPDGDEVQFSHALIREALYEGIPALRRRRLHRQVGETLTEIPNPDPDIVAYHFQQAGDRRAAEWLLKAGERAQRAYVWTTAAERFDAALAKLTQQDAPAVEQAVLLFRIATVLRFADPHRARALMEEAERIAMAAGELGLAASCQFTSGQYRCFVGDIRAGMAVMVEAADAFDALALDEQARCRSLIDISEAPEASLVWWLAQVGRLAEARQRGKWLTAEVPQPNFRADRNSDYIDGHIGLAMAETLLGRPEIARQKSQQARAAYQTTQNYLQHAVTCAFELELVQLPYHPEDLERRKRLADEAEEAGRRVQDVVSDHPAQVFTVLLLKLEGAWNEAHVAASAMLGGRLASERVIGGQHLASLARDQGDVALAHHILTDLLRDGPRTEPGNIVFFATVPLLRTAAALALDAHDLISARSWLEAHDRWLAWSGAVLGRAEGALLWAQYHHANGDPAQARALAEQSLAHASDPRQPLALIAVHRFLGQLDTGERHFDHAEEHLQESLTLAEACAAPFERALTLLEIANLRMAQGNHDQARALLAEVRSICEPLEARPTLERVTTLQHQLEVAT